MMNFVSVLRYIGYAVSGAVMIVGMMAIVGYFVPQHVPEHYRVIFGAVVFLYGAYRYVLTYIRSKGTDQDEE
ncbi:MAG: hypothetical protein KF749_05255 [Bacteroidetes bacterium]|nr:hypothetical protein [Bacteroidota bacterium]MCW5896455.1 hypothetical protein [Bacteroidota bacterium]